jgi:hypothetical protein
MARTFVWHNDPNSSFTGTRDFIGTPGVPGSDSLTYTGFSVTNTSNGPLSDVGFFIPFAWARIDNPDPARTLNHYESLTWDNSKKGFLDSNFNGTGEAVLLTPDIVTHPDTPPDGHVAAGSVADLTDTHVFTPYSTSAEYGLPPVFPPETIQPKDRLPFADLGSFAPGETKTFDIIWTAHWSGADLGAVRVAGYGVSLAPDLG